MMITEVIMEKWLMKSTYQVITTNVEIVLESMGHQPSDILFLHHLRPYITHDIIGGGCYAPLLF